MRERILRLHAVSGMDFTAYSEILMKTRSSVFFLCRNPHQTIVGRFTDLNFCRSSDSGAVGCVFLTSSLLPTSWS